MGGGVVCIALLSFWFGAPIGCFLWFSFALGGGGSGGQGVVED